MVYIPEIHSIRIENFRRIRDPLVLDFTSPKEEPSKNVVFSGPNGCGKTSLLEGILLGLGQEHLIVRDLDRAQRDQHWRTELPAGARIEVTASLDGAPPMMFVRTAEKHVLIGPDGEEIPVGLSKRMAVEYFSSWRAPELVGPIKPLISRGGRPQDTENNRLWRLKQRINDERAKGGYGQSTINKADGWLERINKAWARFHGDDGTKIDAQIVDPDAEELFADLYVLQNGQRQCSIDQVSSGEIELLSFAGWMILNDFDSGLVLIDEPELHLHPRWQKQILMAMHDIAPKAQFIVASHSDAIWAQAYSFERFLMIPETAPVALNATENTG